MCFLRNQCSLCLSDACKLTSQHNLSPDLLEVFGFIIPEYAFHNSEFPSQICDSCLNSLEGIYNFRQQCLQSMETYKAHVQKLKQENDLSNYPNIEEIKLESNLDCYTSDSENIEKMNEPTLEKLQMDELHVKKEIDEEILIKENSEEDSNLFKYGIPNDSEKHNMEDEEEKDEYIPSDDSTEPVSQSSHPDIDPADGTNSIDADEKRHKCDVCQKTFKRKYQVEQHYLIHTGQKPYKCEICQKSFRDSYHFKRHNLIHTNEKPFTCEVCQKTFRDSYYFKIHKLIHTDEKPSILCEVCHKSFRNSYQFKRHKLTHTNVKPFGCEICQKSFRDSYHFKKHNLIHTNEKPFTCEICQKSFRQLPHLKEHHRIHSSVKPYSCSVCQKTFRTSSNLRKHELIHSDNKPYSCEICQKSFRQPAHLKIHYGTHNSDKPCKYK